MSELSNEAENPDEPVTPATRQDRRVIPMEEFLADHGLPPLDPITPINQLPGRNRSHHPVE
jgi:hypothetical protein